MRVMHIMPGAANNGAKAFMLEAVTALGDAGLEQLVITRPNDQHGLNTLTEAGIRVETSSFNRSWPFPTRTRIAKGARAFEPDIIHCWMGRAGMFTPSRWRTRSIGWHDRIYRLERFRNCEWHITVTQDLLRRIRAQGVPDSRSDTIHTYSRCEDTPPVDRAAFDTPADAPLVLAMARLHQKKKGLDTLLDAAKRVPGLYVWIAGDGPLEAALKAQCRALGLTDRVRFLGWRNDRTNLLAACDLVAFPSRYEAFGTLIVDAWASGKPLVVAERVGPAAYVENDVSGLIIAKNDDEALARAICRVLEDKTLADKLIAGGKAAYERKFTRAAFQRDCLAFYKRVRHKAGPFLP